MVLDVPVRVYDPLELTVPATCKLYVGTETPIPNRLLPALKAKLLVAYEELFPFVVLISAG